VLRSAAAGTTALQA